MQPKFSVQNSFGKKLEEIFSEDGEYANLYFEGTETKVVSRGFRFIDNIEKNALLFIGLNPSETEQQIPYSFYNLTQVGNEYKKYWQVFENVGNATDLTWSHLDLLGITETKQTSVRALLKKELGVNFIHEQLMISKQIIEEANPSIIVVSNTLARHFLGKELSEDKKHNIWMGYQFCFDEELGTDRIISDGALNGVPIFFTSMLSGQRALDNGSKERLIWHIKRVMKIISK
jgi:hypothetical protein